MRTRELIEYLEQFKDESVPVILAVNPGERVKYTIQNTILITDQEQPVIGLEINGQVSFDKEETQAAIEDEEEAAR